MARVANLIFDKGHLSLHEITSHILRDILNALPSDSIIVDMGQFVNQATGYLKVESSSFRDITPPGVIPDITINLKVNSQGIASFDSLNMTNALVASSTPTFCICQSIHCNICFPVLTPFSRSFSGIYQSPTVIGTTQGVTFNAPSSIAPRIGYSVAGTNTSGFSGGCQHEWKIYDSGFSRKEYCSKCNVDKS